MILMQVVQGPHFEKHFDVYELLCPVSQAGQLMAELGFALTLLTTLRLFSKQNCFQISQTLQFLWFALPSHYRYPPSWWRLDANRGKHTLHSQHSVLCGILSPNNEHLPRKVKRHAALGELTLPLWFSKRFDVPVATENINLCPDLIKKNTKLAYNFRSWGQYVNYSFLWVAKKGEGANDNLSG